MKLKVLSGLAAALFAVSGLTLIWKTQQSKKPNILIISVCSLRRSLLQTYGADQNLAPAINRFTQKAFTFQNTYSSVSWSNASSYLAKISKSYTDQAGYDGAGACCNVRFLGRHQAVAIPPADFFTQIYRRFHTYGLRHLQAQILKPRDRPFFVQAHFKILHTPYYKTENKYAEKYLSMDQKRRLDSYIQQGPKLLEKAPLLALLFRDELASDGTLVTQHFVQGLISRERKDGLLSLKRHLQAGGLSFLNQRLIDRWATSNDYPEDMELLKDIYKGSLYRLDQDLENVFDLFGDKNLQSNTIVILMGDHGEAFMDHGTLMHGNTIYDEVIGIPFIVRFPGQKIPITIEKQFHQSSLRNLVEGIMQGQVNKENFIQFVETQVDDDVIVSKNCNDDSRSVRYKNKWKFIINFSTSTRELYNLQQDPKEQKNVYLQFPDEAAHLEEILLEKEPDSSNATIYFCR